MEREGRLGRMERGVSERCWAPLGTPHRSRVTFVWSFGGSGLSVL